MERLVPRRTAVSLGFLFFFFLYCAAAVAGQAPSERAALLELKRGVWDPSGILSSWGVADLSHCLWTGVFCDSDSRVVALQISGERGNTEALSSSLLPLNGGPRVRSVAGRGKLKGEISPLVGRLTELRVLSLPHNDLIGEIPEQIWGLEKLEVLSLEGNMLTGEVPGRFSGLKRLRVLNLGFNRISGVIPAGLSECVDLKFLNLAGNMLSGTIPGYLGKLQKLQGLDLSQNRLIGDVPPEIGNSCENLEHLDLSGNLLVGRILEGLANCQQPRTLVSHSIRIVESIDSTNLHRKIMSGHHNLRRSFTSVFSQHRVGRALTSLSVQVKDLEDASLTSEDDSDENSGLNSIEVASIASASAIVVVLLALIILFIYTRKWVPDSRVQGLELREITVFSSVGAPLTFETIIRATGNFNAGNCIGNGGFGATYKAEIHPGITVAVKRLSVGRCQGDQQFHAEIETLGRIRHPNLVTLVGYHASEVEMFLIYNFLPGGNLEKFIKEKSPKSTEWKTLHKIAFDIAHALAYLHDTCVPRVLHRDVKPSNILLDNNLNAYLSDFGLSRLMGTSETHATTSVAGTFGYLAPEYAMTCRVSDKSDVYSYGVVLLELISDKRPLDPSFSSHGDGFNIVTWATMLLKQGRAKEVFTAGLWEAGPHDDLVDMLHVAVVCTNETLSVRPTMKHVVQRLKRIKPLSLGS